jgi:hypothetical protein
VCVTPELSLRGLFVLSGYDSASRCQSLVEPSGLRISSEPVDALGVAQSLRVLSLHGKMRRFHPSSIVMSGFKTLKERKAPATP